MIKFLELHEMGKKWMISIIQGSFQSTLINIEDQNFNVILMF